MSTTIYWFSGTGNSLHAARSIADRLHDETRVVAMAQVLRSGNRPQAEGRIGIVCPVYALGLPAIVQRFIRRLPKDGAESVFAVVTFAATSGGAIPLLQRKLAKRGLPLHQAFGLKMPENYPPMGGPPPDEKQRRLLEQAESKIEKVAATLNQAEEPCREKANILLRTLGRIASPWFSRGLKKADAKFRANDRCNCCGVCARLCPVDNIEIKLEKPAWLGHCEQCFACLHWCPQTAIEYGRRSQRQPRYHHPQTELEDFLQIRGKKAEVATDAAENRQFQW